MNREPQLIVEIDLEYCSNVYGSAPCTAALSAAQQRKCYNGWRTCQDKPNYAPSTRTLRFCTPTSRKVFNMGTMLPVLSSVSEVSSSVNIAGGDDRMSALGERAQVKIRFEDFPYHDRDMDKYVDERISGAAQLDEGGYRPETRGTFFTKLLARFPYLSGRSLRVIEGDISTGDFVETRRRHYYVERAGVPDEDGTVEITAKDVLWFAGDEKAVIPRASSGRLDANIGSGAGSLTLTPVGVGDSEYPASGRIRVGGELMDFTRVADVMTLTTRGVYATAAASHSKGDTVQLVFSVTDMRVDDFIEMVLLTYASNLTAGFIPKVTKWKPEIDRWAPGVLLSTDVTAPIGVSQLLGELASLGFIISWSNVLQEIGLRVNRPVDEDTIIPLTDSQIIEIDAEKRDDDRLSRVVFYTKQRDPTKSLTDHANYDLALLRIDPDAESDREYGSPKNKDIFVRFFNTGTAVDTQIPVLALRLLNRFRDPPVYYRMLLDEQQAALDLVDVVEVTSTRVTDLTGKPVPTRLQIIKKSEVKQGRQFEVIAQSYQYSGRYGTITENTRPDYISSTQAQRDRGAYFSNAGAAFADGGTPYRFI